MRVLKFGGSSIADAASVRRVVDIVRDRGPQPMVLVFSAIGDTTDRLDRIGAAAEQGPVKLGLAEIAELRRDHLRLLDRLSLDGRAVQAVWTGWRPIFNGLDLAGWDGDPQVWSVRDGVIHGETDERSGRTWLVWRNGVPGDFELRLRFRFVCGNSGVQVRSREVEKWSVRGYQVEVANDGKEALEQFTSSPEDFDLIFMDIQMPRMDGMEATKVIREKGFDTIPIVAMTAHAMKGDREKCLEGGMDDYITKPIKRELVFEILEKWVFEKGES